MATIQPTDADLGQTGATALLGSSGSPTTLTQSFAASDTVDAFGHKYVAFWVYVKALSSATELQVRVAISDTGSATATEWTPLNVEEFSSGVATQFNYVQKITLPGSVSTDTLIGVVVIPIRGVRYYRVALKADAGSPTVFVKTSLSGG